tara:strand:+ start:2480 stop:2725 length:246 start_codon:yes stop_codon:yes gene_type:complete
MKKLLACACLVFITTSTWAQNLDAESVAALQQTITLLTDQAQRDALVSANPAAASADKLFENLLIVMRKSRLQFMHYHRRL